MQNWKFDGVIVDPLGNRYEVNLATMTPQFAHVMLLLLQIHDQNYPEHTRRWVRSEVSQATTAAETPAQLRKTSSQRRAATFLPTEQGGDDTDRRFSIDVDSIPPNSEDDDK